MGQDNGPADVYQRMLDELDKGRGVLTASEFHPDIPTIHTVGQEAGVRDSVKHLGFGCFEGVVNGEKFSFDGGGALRDRDQKDGDLYMAWTPLFTSSKGLEALGYDADKVRATIEELARAPRADKEVV